MDLLHQNYGMAVRARPSQHLSPQPLEKVLALAAELHMEKKLFSMGEAGNDTFNYTFQLTSFDLSLGID